MPVITHGLSLTMLTRQSRPETVRPPVAELVQQVVAEKVACE